MDGLYLKLALTLLLSIFIAYKFFLRKKHNYPPGPRALPIIGNLHLIKPGPLYLYYETVSKRLGPIILFWMGKVPVMVISSPEAFEECFTKNDLIFADRPKTVSGDHLTYNYTFIVFAPHGPIWKSLRRLTFSEIFSQKALQRSAFVREEEARHFVGRLLKCTAGGNKPKLDMKYMLSLLTSSVIMRVAAGKRHVAVSDEDTEEEKRLMQEFKDLFFPIVSMTPCDFIPVLRMIGFKGIEKSIIQLGKKREVFLNKLLVEVRARRGADAEKRLNGEKPNAVVDTLLNLQETDPEFYTDDIIKGIITMMFIAGTETSTATLEWALTLLLQHPKKMEKLRAEIDGVVGDTRLVNESDFSKLPYLKAVVKETMRLYPPSPLLLPRYSSEACTIGGYYVPKGTMLLVNVWTMHRDPKLWDEPNEFKPERFVEGDLEGYLYQPFGHGRRICPGAGMGTHIVCETLGMLVQCFDWDQIGMDEDMTHQAGAASMSKNKPLEASFAPRSEMAKLLSQL
uniref:1,3,5-trihydroxyxanthone synthase n=1 Tax=Hypericum perforatum TaxID=65561 RepID=A0A161I263_HYPPE|nr:1,3,5-trihydroxyxanthone synthase [Hypericum perforatum]